MFFKRLKIAEKNATDAWYKANELEKWMEKKVEEFKQCIASRDAEISALKDYILADVKCPVCGRTMSYAVEGDRVGIFSRLSDSHRLKCPCDGFEIRSHSLKGCVGKLREIEEKQKKGETACIKIE